MAVDSLHVDIPDAQIHTPKGFGGSGKNAMPVKDEQGGLLWETRYTLPPAKGFVTGANIPPTETHGDIYVLIDSSVLHANWDGAAENDWVRFDTSADTWFSISPVDGILCYDQTSNALKIFGTEWTIGGEGQPQILETSLLIASADVLTLNGTPIEIVATPGGKFAIEIVSWSTKAVGNGVLTAYATNTELQLKINTADQTQGKGTEILKSTISRVVRGQFETPGAPWSATDQQIIEDKALMVTVKDGNPTTGTFDIKIFVNYRIIKL